MASSIVVGRWGQAMLVLLGGGSGCGGVPASDGSEASTSSTVTSSDVSSSASGVDTTASLETGTTGSADGPPVVVDIGQSQVRITSGEVVVLTAFVSHPQGDDAVVSGRLWGPGEPADYGEFQPVGPGRWSIELGYDDTESRGRLEYGEFLDVEFTARFEDVQGRTAERDVLVRHDCEISTSYSCAGECISVNISNQHCGGCGIQCEEQSVAGSSAVLGDCFKMACTPSWSGCVEAEGSRCDDVCGEAGRNCAPGGCGGGTVLQESDTSMCGLDLVIGNPLPGASCAEPLPAGRHRCCCDPLAQD